MVINYTCIQGEMGSSTEHMGVGVGSIKKIKKYNNEVKWST